MLKFITGNKNKFKEVEAILGVGNVEMLDIDLPETQELDPNIIIQHKLEEAKALGITNCFVEDGSFKLKCLNGLPGPLIKWFLKSIGAKGLYEITQKFNNNKAEASIIIGLLPENGEVEFFEGMVTGTVVEPGKDNGFGWDVIFVPDGHTSTYAGMPMEEKNKISHRRIAVEKLRTKYILK